MFFSLFRGCGDHTVVKFKISRDHCWKNSPRGQRTVRQERVDRSNPLPKALCASVLRLAVKPLHGCFQRFGTSLNPFLFLSTYFRLKLIQNTPAPDPAEQ